MRNLFPLLVVALTLSACMAPPGKSPTAVAEPDVRELLKNFPAPHTVTKDYESDEGSNYSVRLPGHDTVVAVYVYKVPHGIPVEAVMRQKLMLTQAPPVREKPSIGDESWLLGEAGHLFRQGRNVIFVGAAPAIPKAKVRSIAVHIARALQPR